MTHSILASGGVFRKIRIHQEYESLHSRSLIFKSHLINYQEVFKSDKSYIVLEWTGLKITYMVYEEIGGAQTNTNDNIGNHLPEEEKQDEEGKGKNEWSGDKVLLKSHDKKIYIS